MRHIWDFITFKVSERFRGTATLFSSENQYTPQGMAYKHLLCEGLDHLTADQVTLRTLLEKINSQILTDNYKAAGKASGKNFYKLHHIYNMLNYLIDEHNNNKATTEAEKINKTEYLDTFYNKYLHKGTPNIFKWFIVGGGITGAIGLIALGLASSGLVPAAVAFTYLAKFALLPLAVNLWRFTKYKLGGQAYAKSWKRSVQKELWSVYNFVETISRSIPVVAKALSCTLVLALSCVLLPVAFILDLVCLALPIENKPKLTQKTSKCLKHVVCNGIFNHLQNGSHYLNTLKASAARKIGTGTGDFKKLNNKAITTLQKSEQKSEQKAEQKAGATKQEEAHIKTHNSNASMNLIFI